MNGEDWPEPADRKWPYSRASAQVRLVIDACAATGVTIGVRLNGDQVDFVYEEGALLVRDAYADRVRAVVGGGDVTDGLTGGVTRYSLAGARLATVTEALAAIDAWWRRACRGPARTAAVPPTPCSPRPARRPCRASGRWWRPAPAPVLAPVPAPVLAPALAPALCGGSRDWSCGVDYLQARGARGPRFHTGRYREGL